MLELPEAMIISEQMNQTIKGKRIKKAVAASTAHGLAWYYKDPADYDALLKGRRIESAKACAGRVEISAEGATLNFLDGASPKLYDSVKTVPAKHQLLLVFDDDSALAATIAMYGGLMAFPNGAMDDDFYYNAAKTKPSPLSEAFDYEYFLTLFDEKSLKLSAKAFLATEQRIPGLGNGVLHDILLNTKIHPKKKVSALTEAERKKMFESIKMTFSEMVEKGGRDTERDFFGRLGGYPTKLSKNNKLLICPDCGGAVKKEAYLGGSIYYCTECQKL